MRGVHRILDANANRAREALRVMEEAARFILDDAVLTQDLKTLRHEIAATLSPLEPLSGDRDTAGDVGRETRTDAEYDRTGVVDVAAAAGRRLGEALRALEEYGKTIDGDMAARIETLRYRGYELDQRLTSVLPGGHHVGFGVCVLVTAALCTPHDWLDVAEAAVVGGADCLQLREKGLADDVLLDRARMLVGRVNGRAAVIINDRPDIAFLAGADGVHLGQDDLPCRAVRRLVGRRLLIGVSTSRLEEARQARRDGADYCGVGPMFPSATKPREAIAGAAYLREYLDWDGLPHLAISGITLDNVDEVVAQGARGVAVSRAVCASDSPGDVVRSLKERLTIHR